MPRSPSGAALTGSRIRERRLALGVKQADLARRVGISAAYLNLIEHNRRRIGGKLVIDLAEALDVDVSILTEGAEAALTASLREAAAAASAPPDRGETAEEFAGRFPGWARVLAEAQARNAALRRTVEALSDRLTHDPFLSASLHEVLSAVTGVRSTAAILADTEDIDPAWQRRFLRNLREDSRRLSAAAQALVGYLDADGPGTASASTPQEELEGWLARQGWRIAALEADPSAAVEPEGIASGAGRDLAARWIARYAEDARALPEAEVLAGIGGGSPPDPARLAAARGVPLSQALRRIACLSGERAGLVLCDGAGTLTLKKPVPGFGLPRFAAACPLWPLYQALIRPGVPVRAAVEMPGRMPARFLTCSVAEVSHPGGFDAPPVVEATMLVLADAAGPSEPALPVGTSCRICPRPVCAARREPSVLSG